MNQSVECSVSAQFFSGYNVVVLIPAGATNIDVRQHSFSGKSEDDNYLGEMGAPAFCRNSGSISLYHVESFQISYIFIKDIDFETHYFIFLHTSYPQYIDLRVV